METQLNTIDEKFITSAAGSKTLYYTKISLYIVLLLNWGLDAILILE
jgi:hypothetical protein